MGKLTKEQTDLLAELEQLRDAPDDDVEVYVRDERGRETRLTGAHAQRWIGELFGDAGDAAGGGGKPAKKAAAAKKAAPAKKTTAAAGAAGSGDDGDPDDADDGDQGDGDDGDPGDPEPVTRHWYFGSATGPTH